MAVRLGLNFDGVTKCQDPRSHFVTSCKLPDLSFSSFVTPLEPYLDYDSLCARTVTIGWVFVVRQALRLLRVSVIEVNQAKRTRHMPENVRL